MTKLFSLVLILCAFHSSPARAGATAKEVADETARSELCFALGEEARDYECGTRATRSALQECLVSSFPVKIDPKLAEAFLNSGDPQYRTDVVHAVDETVMNWINNACGKIGGPKLVTKYIKRIVIKAVPEPKPGTPADTYTMSITAGTLEVGMFASTTSAHNDLEELSGKFMQILTAASGLTEAQLQQLADADQTERSHRPASFNQKIPQQLTPAERKERDRLIARYLTHRPDNNGPASCSQKGRLCSRASDCCSGSCEVTGRRDRGSPLMSCQ